MFNSRALVAITSFPALQAVLAAAIRWSVPIAASLVSQKQQPIVALTIPLAIGLTIISNQVVLPSYGCSISTFIFMHVFKYECPTRP